MRRSRSITRLPATCVFLALLSAAAPAHSVETRDPFGERMRACAACHGERGRSDAETYYPSIAGKPAGYLHAQLVNFRDGRRENAIMKSMLAYLSDEYLREIAGYYSAQAPVLAAAAAPPPSASLELGRRLVDQGDAQREIPACRDCHGAGLKGVAPAIPGLLGLRAEYLSAQIGAWRTGVRRAAAPDCMATISKRLTVSDISALTAWIASRPYTGDHHPATSLPGPLPLPCGGVQ